MTERQPYRRRAIHELRDENAPVGAINSTGFGASKLGQHITALVLDESTLMVVVASNGEVYALDPTGLRATATASVHPEWICGTYTSRCGAGRLPGICECRRGSWGGARMNADHAALEALASRICESSADGNGDYDAKGTKKAYWRKRAQAVMDRQRGLNTLDALMGIFGFTREQK